MHNNILECTKCGSALPGNLIDKEKSAKCPSCYTSLQIYTFPALFRSIPKGQFPETLTIDNEAGCFYHPQKKAEIICKSCGRFICKLCDIEFKDEHLCPVCLETSGKKGKNKDGIETDRILYDDIALSLAIIPMITIWLTFITAPTAVFISIYYWKTQSSIIPRTKIRFVSAVILGVLQITGWIFAIRYLSSR